MQKKFKLKGQQGDVYDHNHLGCQQFFVLWKLCLVSYIFYSLLGGNLEYRMFHDSATTKFNIGIFPPFFNLSYLSWCSQVDVLYERFALQIP